MPSNANVKTALPFLFLFLLLTGCNMPTSGLPAFIAPSGVDRTATPDWAATLEAAIPATESSASGGNLEIEAGSDPQDTATPTPTAISTGPILYYTQAGDTLKSLAIRFDVTPEAITSTDLIPQTGFINPNQLLIIPNRLSNTTVSSKVLPDSEFVYSLSAISFDVDAFVNDAGGYLKNYHEYLGSSGETYGGDIIELIALDNSVNPRLLLALLEFQSGWVSGIPGNLAERDYPFGEIDADRKGLLRQLKWAVNQLSIGYYGWREGRMSEIHFRDGVTARLAPDLNAGTAALQYYFAQVYDSNNWLKAMDPVEGFPALYERMFGNAWTRAQLIEPLFPPDLTQPQLELPFLVGPIWSFTGGPHGAWEHDGSWAAIDFAPSSTESGCIKTDAWVTASAPGLVVRSERGIVVLDMDGDGFEQTGWAMVYLHIEEDGRIREGTYVDTGDYLGHPSCEGGVSTGTHVHLARKYNGEWMTADGPIPFVLTGWMVHEGSRAYQGTLTRDGETVKANQFGAFESRIMRDRYYAGE
jgi:LasA protease